MSTSGRGGLKAAFSQFRRVEEAEGEAERKLLGRTAEGPSPAEKAIATVEVSGSYQPATYPLSGSSLIARPRIEREAVRQLSFRCPVSLAVELRRKAALNQLEQQEILIEGLRRVLAELPSPPDGWEKA